MTAMAFEVSGQVVHLRAHGKKLIFVDVDQSDGIGIELLVKEAALGGPIPTLGAGDVINAQGTYDEEGSKHGSKLLLKCSSITVVQVKAKYTSLPSRFIALSTASCICRRDTVGTRIVPR